MAIEDVFDPYDIFAVIVPGSFLVIPLVLIEGISIQDVTSPIIVLLIFLSYVFGQALVALSHATEAFGRMITKEANKSQREHSPIYSPLFRRAFIDESSSPSHTLPWLEYEFINQFLRRFGYEMDTRRDVNLLLSNFSESFTRKYNLDKNSIDPSEIESIYNIVVSEIRLDSIPSIERSEYRISFLKYTIISMGVSIVLMYIILFIDLVILAGDFLIWYFFPIVGGVIMLTLLINLFQYALPIEMEERDIQIMSYFYVKNFGIGNTGRD